MDYSINHSSVSAAITVLRSPLQRTPTRRRIWSTQCSCRYWPWRESGVLTLISQKPTEGHVFLAGTGSPTPSLRSHTSLSPQIVSARPLIIAGHHAHLHSPKFCKGIQICSCDAWEVEPNFLRFVHCSKTALFTCTCLCL